MKNILATFYRHFWKYVPSSIVYMIFAMMILTNGLASAGMTCVARNVVWSRHTDGLSDFVEGIKKSWGKALGVGIVNVIIYVLLVFDFWFFSSFNGTLELIGQGVIIFALIFWTMMNYYIWTLMLTFNYSLKQVFVNSFKFVFVNFGKNVLCFLCHLAIYILYFIPVYFFADYALKVIFIELIVCFVTYPAFKYILIQYSIFPVLKKYIIEPYYNEHVGEDKEKREFLGL